MRFSRVIALARKEWMEAFHSTLASMIMALFFLATGWFFTEPLFLEGQANMDGLIDAMPILLSVFLPALTMRLFAEEYKTGTFDVLSALPLSDGEIVLGKFIGALGLWILMVVLSAFYFLLLVIVGPPDRGALAASYVGVLLAGTSFLSLGLLASLLSRTQVTAFLSGFLLCFIFVVVESASTYAPGMGGRVFSFLSVAGRLAHFQRGVVDARDVIFFLSLTATALLGAWTYLIRRRTA